MPPFSAAAGRFAPSPTGELHVGNLRTALLAWLFARSTGRRFLLRMEDLDRVRSGADAAQLRDLAAVGLDWDGDILRQSERTALYLDAIAELRGAGLVYECFCTRREVAEAASAPHAPPGAYPGTCRHLTEEQRAQRRLERPAALRLRAQVDQFTITDELYGSYTSAVDDLVLLRNDGVPSYNLAVVLDDALQGIDQVVRGDDLLSSAPRQAYLGSLLGLPPVSYAHVPLALNTAGQRLAKRDGAVTLPDLAAAGLDADAVRTLILGSLGLPGNLRDALAEFSPDRIPLEPWTVDPAMDLRH
ncbi:tRNA glutamyl-Q(34) synthetase GluQRS [Arthrobacter sp. zg-Y877]|uniref:tRNA glutamyl-Q(34) synthetase GluQRS n=1 Tax=Arthrobacter sp. zg-Y877 TaxID=3049074 RepID=UPI0025A318EB|nr:tRNA glutamyl-Q(34) synthetase GluQRS [Arthrobacter sp. zg-Y877]MDM7990754.1 tRNA glutamyl-Q(34) synthetase GluQRS [Arthrobacter sp. zg-Y877]